MSVKEMSSQELTKRVVGNKELFVLDVRNADAFKDWKVEGKHFEYLNVPYFDLLEGVEDILKFIPGDKEILVVCAKEGSSIMVADMLSEEGLDVFYLQGGMKAWSEYLEPVKVGDLNNGGELYQFVRMGKGCLSYMLISEGEAAIFDSARMTEQYLKYAEEAGVVIKNVFDTHLHADHISGGRSLAAQTGATYWLPPLDAEEVTFDFSPLKDKTLIKVGNSEVNIAALYSPGHTIGSTSFLIDDAYLLTGDILFIDSIGRPDLAGKAQDWVGDLRESLYSRYKELSGELIVLPAHFMSVSELNEDGSAAEKLAVLFELNHGLKVAEEAEFRKLVTENLPPQPHAYEEIRQVNMGKIQPHQEEEREMEIGPNRCAVR
ncbi:MBL fold metallo-hydrolase [Bacillus lacus]|uniref:MBL fold metallo-hydrolase n=1 Tax=Metabacillus lacus TaxID=1983721 RepID=A0A7X2M1A3_9BACI|nr:MBL fold metallo-hydrolase [Metabacillus lacus]MRX73924.1 MBL fold metallo-hydrolase [Metabacillus lacus]